MTFTKEQLITQAREEVTFWRERDEIIPSQQTAIRLRLAEITLAALREPKQEPVAWRYRYVHTPKSEEHGSYFTTDWVITHSGDECNPSDCLERQPLYAAPPVPVVPENPPEHLLPQGNSRDATYRRGATINGWMLCRAAMLQGKAELPAYEIKRFGEFGANGLTRGDGELAISIQLFNFERGTTPELERGAIVEKYALQAIINALQQQCDRLSDAPIPVIWPAAPQQEVG